jgi:hypothetical protein
MDLLAKINSGKPASIFLTYVGTRESTARDLYPPFEQFSLAGEPFLVGRIAADGQKRIAIRVAGIRDIWWNP